MLEWHDFSEDKPKIKHKDEDYYEKWEYSDQILFMVDNKLYLGKYYLLNDYMENNKYSAIELAGYQILENGYEVKHNRTGDYEIQDKEFCMHKIYWTETEDVQRSFLNYCLLNHKEAL